MLVCFSSKAWKHLRLLQASVSSEAPQKWLSSVMTRSRISLVSQARQPVKGTGSIWQKDGQHYVLQYTGKGRLASNVMKAKIGDRSKVPPIGGMIPLKRFR